MKNRTSAAALFLCVLFCSCCTPATVAKTDTIEIPFTLRNNRIILRAEINGTRGNFIWDTGSPISVVNIRTDNLAYLVTDTHIFPSFNLTIEAPRYQIDEITVGGVTLNTLSLAMTIPEQLNLFFQREKIDGILSISIFEGYWCEISFSKQKILLHKEKPAQYKKQVPVHILHNNDFCIPVDVDGTSVDFAVDTGMQEALRFPESIPGQDTAVRVASTDEIDRFFLVKTKKVQIFDRVFRNGSVFTTSIIGQNFGLIGIGFLQFYDLLFDFTELTSLKSTNLYFKSIVTSKERDYGSYSIRPYISASGILRDTVSRYGFTIEDMTETGFAYTGFGLRPGTRITKVNGEPILQLLKTQDAEDIFDIMTECTVFENGEARTITFTPKQSRR
jgi:hypothetical protein